jgi:hypothetical protein
MFQKTLIRRGSSGDVLSLFMFYKDSSLQNVRGQGSEMKGFHMETKRATFLNVKIPFPPEASKTL